MPVTIRVRRCNGEEEEVHLTKVVPSSSKMSYRVSAPSLRRKQTGIRTPSPMAASSPVRIPRPQPAQPRPWWNSSAPKSRIIASFSSNPSHSCRPSHLARQGSRSLTSRVVGWHRQNGVHQIS